MGTFLQIPIATSSALAQARQFAAGASSAPLPEPQLPGQQPPDRPSPETSPARRSWTLDVLAGGIVEISGAAPAAGLTAATRLIREAQERGEPAAWIAADDSVFYAPDLHDSGVDLAALPVVRVRGPLPGARAAEHLLRSGAFALLVLDLVGSAGPAGTRAPAGFRASGGSGRWRRAELPAAAQVRLAALCRRHQAALLLLARRPPESPPIASLAVFRAEGTVQRTAFDRFTFRLQALKDKRQGGGWSHEETFRGPDGLC